jgi:hypothetical protein
LVYKLIASGKLHCRRHGLGRGVIRVGEEQLADYLAAAEQDPPPAPTAAAPRGPRLKHIRL